MNSLSNRQGSKTAQRTGGTARGAGAQHVRRMSAEKLDGVFAAVGQGLRDGMSREAERLLLKTIEGYTHPPDIFAHLKRLLSFTLETLGRYEESLEVLRPFEDEEMLSRLEPATQIHVATDRKSVV